jgi:phosphoribosylaminoimidazolecarboxamide formyltransferase / IMP cyclohydrolase
MDTVPKLIATSVANMNNSSVRSTYTKVVEDPYNSLSIILNGKRYDYEKVMWVVRGNEIKLATGNQPPAGWDYYGVRYGYNACQRTARFVRKNQLPFGSIDMVRTGKGTPSLTNLEDMAYALQTLKFAETPAVVGMKHLIPSQMGQLKAGQSATPRDLTDLFARVQGLDQRSIFGGTWGFNFEPTEEIMEMAGLQFYENAIAPSFHQDALNYMNRKGKSVRLATTNNISRIPKFKGDDTYGIVAFNTMPDGAIHVQEPYLSSVRTIDDLTIKPILKNKEGRVIAESTIDVDQETLKDLLFAHRVNFTVRSNGVVAARDRQTLGIGTGEQERIGAMQQLYVKAFAKRKFLYQNALTTQALHSIGPKLPIKKLKTKQFITTFEDVEDVLEGGVLSSDAYIPDGKCIEAIADCGIKAIILPPGSLSDHAVVNACEKFSIAVVYVPPEDRCFDHH